MGSKAVTQDILHKEEKSYILGRLSLQSFSLHHVDVKTRKYYYKKFDLRKTGITSRKIMYLKKLMHVFVI